MHTLDMRPFTIMVSKAKENVDAEVYWRRGLRNKKHTFLTHGIYEGQLPMTNISHLLEKTTREEKNEDVML